MKILTLIGTRPELIRLSILIKKLDDLVEHIVVYTNQNYDYNLSKIFFKELEIRNPNYYFEKESKSFTEFLSNAIIEFEKIIIKESPDKIIILGDTNTGLLSIMANRYQIPIYHLEAGNRCFDNRLPEESNRKIIDSISTYNLPYTENSKQNLLKEGYHKNYVFKIGNPIYEVLNFYKQNIDNSSILNKLQLTSKEYCLVTIHRTENTNDKNILNNIFISLNEISNYKKIILSLHPRTKNKLENYNIKINKNIIICEPFGFFDFVKLEQNSFLTISDSGTVQEECCIFNVPSLTIRETTERQETIECGSNILCGTDTSNIINSFNIVKNKKFNYWNIPNDYLISNVSDIVTNILIGK
jgi:UDP-N-acetylglucosamine 2-epimerase (non-hydrolysing)